MFTFKNGKIGVKRDSFVNEPKIALVPLVKPSPPCYTYFYIPVATYL